LALSPIKFFRNIGRTREIVSILLNHGFGDVVDRLRLMRYMRWWRRVVLRKSEPAPALTLAQRLRMAPQAWSPLGGGRLSREPAETPLGQALARLGQQLDATPEQLAIAWLLRHPARIQPVLGSGKLGRTKLLVEAQQLSLDRQAWFELLQAATGNEVP